MGWTEHVRTPGRTAGGRATAAVQLTKFVGVEKSDLPFRNLVDDGPVVQKGAAQTDEDDSLTVAFEKMRHFSPEFVQGCIRPVFKRHTSAGDQIPHHLAENPANGYQSNPFGQYAAQVVRSLQVFQNTSEQDFGLCITDG